MAQYFRRVPIWVIGTAKIVRDTLVALAAISTFNQPDVVLWVMVAREIVGNFVKYSEREVKSKV